MIDYESKRSNKTNYFYHQFDNNLNFPAHIHHSFEYIYCFEGEIELNIEKNTYTLKPGQAAVIFPLQIHSYVTRKHSKTCLFVFASSFISSFYKEYSFKRPEKPIFDFSEYEYINMKLLDADTFLKKSYLYLIISVFVQNTTFSEYNLKTQDLTLKIIEYIRNNFNLNPSLPDLCSSLGYSYNYISGFMNRIFHSNFMQLINEYRIDYAQRLLTETSDNITQIATQCGYESLQSFNRNFKKVVGVTPTEFKTKAASVSKS